MVCPSPCPGEQQKHSNWFVPVAFDGNTKNLNPTQPSQLEPQQQSSASKTSSPQSFSSEDVCNAAPVNCMTGITVDFQGCPLCNPDGNGQNAPYTGTGQGGTNCPKLDLSKCPNSMCVDPKTGCPTCDCNKGFMTSTRSQITNTQVPMTTTNAPTATTQSKTKTLHTQSTTPTVQTTTVQVLPQSTLATQQTVTSALITRSQQSSSATTQLTTRTHNAHIVIFTRPAKQKNTKIAMHLSPTTNSPIFLQKWQTIIR